MNDSTVSSDALAEQVEGLAAVQARLQALALQENILRSQLSAVIEERKALETLSGQATQPPVVTASERRSP